MDYSVKNKITVMGSRNQQKVLYHIGSGMVVSSLHYIFKGQLVSFLCILSFHSIALNSLDTFSHIK